MYMIRTTATALLLFLTQVSAQTLYMVSEEIPSFTEIVSGATTLSVAGVGADGWTTYDWGGSVSLQVEEEPTTTFTAISTPVGLAGHFEANSAGWREIGGAINDTCAFGSDGRGTCVERIAQASSTRIVTISGSVVPFYTLGVIPGSSTPTPTPTSSAVPNQPATSTTPNGAAVRTIPALWITVSFVVCALPCVL
ncbi:hypothetical protein B0H17DRAFT_1084981 [Mycena rosella]|uniref:Uncharacterized protein n=1 Tax=Mycena rosella TaxID=1033263 RepID=A0AAD7D063_MYCRO|nr:hypothetical protein B0H17DRAFT_1084981 [Mycena rosella]